MTGNDHHTIRPSAAVRGRVKSVNHLHNAIFVTTAAGDDLFVPASTGIGQPGLTLDDLTPGEEVTVIAYEGSRGLRGRNLWVRQR